MDLRALKSVVASCVRLGRELRRRQSTRPSPLTTRRARPNLEVLDDRILPATSTWTWNSGHATSNWNDAANWTNGVPGAGDTAVFDGSSDTNATVSANTTVGHLIIDDAYTSTITLNGDLTILGNSLMENGEIAGSGDLIVDGGEFEWQGGTIGSSSLSLLEIETGATLAISVDIVHLSKTLENHGTITLHSELNSTAPIFNEGGEIYVYGEFGMDNYFGGNIVTSDVFTQNDGYTYLYGFDNTQFPDIDERGNLVASEIYLNAGTMEMNQGGICTTAGSIYIAFGATLAVIPENFVSFIQTDSLENAGVLSIVGTLPIQLPHLELFGDYVQTSTGLLTLEVGINVDNLPDSDPTHPADLYLFVVWGTMSLAGSLEVTIAGPLSYAPSDHYCFVGHAGGYSGTFSSVSIPSAFTLNYNYMGCLSLDS